MDIETYGFLAQELSEQTQKVQNAENELQKQKQILSELIEHSKTPGISMQERVNIEKKRIAQENVIKSAENNLKSEKTMLDDFKVRANREAFKAAGFSVDSIEASLFSDVYGDLLSEDDFSKLRFTAPMFFGKAPDGTYRVRKTERGETANCHAFILQITHPSSTYYSGKQECTAPEYTEQLWILSNNYVSHHKFRKQDLDRWFFDWFMNDMPETEYEREMSKSSSQYAEPIKQPIEQQVQQQEQETQITPTAQKQKQAQWRTQGLCLHCGGKRSWLSGRCRICGK